MNSKREFSQKCLLNKSGTSKASAQLKIILSISVFILASALIMYAAYAENLKTGIKSSNADTDMIEIINEKKLVLQEEIETETFSEESSEEEVDITPSTYPVFKISPEEKRSLFESKNIKRPSFENEYLLFLDSSKMKVNPLIKGVGISGDLQTVMKSKNILVSETLPEFNAVKVYAEDSKKDSLNTLPGVIRVEKIKMFHTLLNISAPQINADDVWALDINGTGVDICIIDTGIDKWHSTLKQATESADFTTNDWCIDLGYYYYDEDSGYFSSVSGTSRSYNQSINITSALGWINIGITSYYNGNWSNDSQRYDITVYWPNGTKINDTSLIPNTNLVLDADSNLWAIMNISVGSVTGLYTVEINETSIGTNNDYPLVIWGENITHLYDTYYTYWYNCDTYGVNAASPVYNSEPKTFYNIVANDDNLHGTHVAGTIISSNETYMGIAPGANIYIAKALNSYGSGTTYGVLQAIEWCKSKNVDIISMSLGSTAEAGCSDSAAILIDSLSRFDIISVIAAGNDGPSATTIGTPGCARNALTVGAVNESDGVASFSSRGPTNDTLPRTKPEVVAPGVGIHATAPGNVMNYPLDGTSMSTPHVSGVAALIIQKNPTWTPGQIKAAIINSANQSKAGLSNHDNSYGFGRVDALEAVNNTWVTSVNITNGMTDETLKISIPSARDVKITIYWEENSSDTHSRIYLNITNSSGILDYSEEQNNTIQQVAISSAVSGDYNLKIIGHSVASPKTVWVAANAVILESIAPIVTIVSPVNLTYGASVTFNVSVNEDASVCLFSLDGTANVSMTSASLTSWHYTNSSMTDGSHNVIFYCNDTSDNWNSTETRYFTVDSTGPSIDSFTDSDLNTRIDFNYSDCYTNGPCSINFWVNLTNSSAAGVNLTHGGICMGGTDPQPMSYRNDGYTDFYYGCVINSATLESMGSPFNVTVGSYYHTFSAGYGNEANYTINYDFENPRIVFDWWNTKDAQGDSIILPHYKDILNESDMFYSVTDNTVYFKVNATDNQNVGGVYVFFTKDSENDSDTDPVDDLMELTGGDCNGTLDLSLDSGFWIGNCSLGVFDEDDLDTIKEDWFINYSIDEEGGPVLSFNAEIYAEDDFGNTNLPYNISFDDGTECEMPPVEGQCMPALAPILMHDIGVMGFTTLEDVREMIRKEYGCSWDGECEDAMCSPGEDPELDDCWEQSELCFLLDNTTTTDFNKEFNFSSVDFKVGINVNISCIADAWGVDSDYELPNTFETMMTMNLTSLDFNNQETGMKLAMLPDNIEVLINMPGQFGYSQIFVNSTAFEELDTDATIKFFHLPFTAEPDVDDTRTAGLAGSVWAQDASDDFWNGLPAGNLTLEVKGFSDYEILDSEAPTISIDAPENDANLTVNHTWINMTLNGTGTQISNVLVYDGATLEYNYSEDSSKCYNVSQGSELFFCNISITGLADGNHAFTVYAFDFGAEEPGNNASESVNITVDTTAPSINITSPESNAMIGTAMLPYNITGTASDNLVGIDSIEWYVNDAGQGSVDMSPLPLWWTNWNPSDGTYNITAQACDYFDNCANATEVTLITVDKTAPEVDITAPSDLDVLTSSTVIVNVTTTEANPNQLKLYVNGTLAGTKTYESGTVVTTFTVSLADGIHGLGVIANDMAGNINVSTNITIEVDTTAPVASPITESLLTNESITISASTDEDALCKVEYGTTTALGTNESMSGILPVGFTPLAAYAKTHGTNLTGLDAGTKYYYKLTCGDEHGNSGSSSTRTFTTENYQTEEIDNSTTTTITFNFTEDGTTTTGAEIEISLNESANATVKVARSSSSENANFSLSGHAGMNIYYTIESGEINATNIEWVYIKLYYDEADLPANVDESALRLYWYNTSSSAWEEIVPGGVNTDDNYVWGNSTHFSEYTAAGEETADTEASSTSSSRTGSGASVPRNKTAQSVNLDEVVTFDAEKLIVGDKILFTLNHEQHMFELVSMTQDSIYVEISSVKTSATLFVGDAKAVDVDKNGINDIELLLKSMQFGKADVTLTKIDSAGAPAEPQAPADEVPATEETVSEPAEEKTEQTGVDLSVVFAVAMAVLIAGGAIVIYKYVMSKKK